ncbi:MAG: threonine aldolase [Betaproteobacteria bacterium HGW-Betaproteobacteria-16]|nr:MAG: threonine aldolase [Betaproteobacteria bacterium HGW-Betaproteobacteria-16]
MNDSPAQDPLHSKYGLTPVINAAGSFTPLGVSRSSAHVAHSAAAALQSFFVMNELQALASDRLSAFSGCEAAAVTHCVSAAITQAVAACIAGTDAEAVANLPEAKGRANAVVIPAGHCVNYGHLLVTDIRLAGATVIQAGTREACSLRDIEQALDQPGVCCLLLVSSRLTTFQNLDTRGAVTAARTRGIPVVIDGAAQDMRIPELLGTGADAVLISAHKYLASPTAGLVLGTRTFVERFRAQEAGIGRAMKPSKEAIVGVLAALEERQAMEPVAWRQQQDKKVAKAMALLSACPDIQASAEPDPVGMPFQRVRVRFLKGAAAARAVAQTLKAGNPSIWVMEHQLDQGAILLELVALSEEEVQQLVGAIGSALAASASG